MRPTMTSLKVFGFSWGKNSEGLLFNQLFSLPSKYSILCPTLAEVVFCDEK